MKENTKNGKNSYLSSGSVYSYVGFTLQWQGERSTSLCRMVGASLLNE